MGLFMLIGFTKCENFMFVRLTWLFLIRFESCQFQYSFPLITSVIVPLVKYADGKHVNYEVLGSFSLNNWFNTEHSHFYYFEFHMTYVLLIFLAPNYKTIYATQRYCFRCTTQSSLNQRSRKLSTRCVTCLCLFHCPGLVQRYGSIKIAPTIHWLDLLISPMVSLFD